MSRKIPNFFKVLVVLFSASLFFLFFFVLFSPKIPFIQVGAHVENDGEPGDGCCPRPTKTVTPTPLCPTPTSTSAPTPTLTETPVLTPTPTPITEFTPTPTTEVSATPTPPLEPTATPTPAELLILKLVKTNDKQSGASPGEIVKYFLTISDIRSDLTTLSLIDNLPEGFSYQGGSAAVTGGTVVSSEPAITNGGKTLTWNWNAVPALTTVAVTYNARISDSNKPATYTDFAWVKGMASSIPAESNIARSDVPIGPEYSFSAAVGGTVLGAEALPAGEILGAVLPATGADNAQYLSIAFLMIGCGLLIKRKAA